MNRCLLIIVCFLFSITSFAQVTNRGNKFTEVYEVDGKVVFIKEIQSKSNLSTESVYAILKNWAKDNYGKDPFISSVRYDGENHEIIAKSRIELLLPANSKGEREKIVMRYRVNSFIFQEKCILEITELVYLYDNPKKAKILPRVSRAEDLITDSAIAINDNVSELRANTRKSTLYFLNELADGLEKRLKE